MPGGVHPIQKPLMVTSTRGHDGSRVFTDAHSLGRSDVHADRPRMRTSTRMSLLQPLGQLGHVVCRGLFTDVIACRAKAEVATGRRRHWWMSRSPDVPDLPRSAAGRWETCGTHRRCERRASGSPVNLTTRPTTRRVRGCSATTVSLKLRSGLRCPAESELACTCHHSARSSVALDATRTRHAIHHA